MMTRKTTLLAITAILALALAGCGTLASGGAYNGDKVLYQADSTVWTAYQAIDASLKWESVNYRSLSPQLQAAANAVRAQAPKAFSSYAALRATYLANKNTANQNSLQGAVNDLIALANTAAQWLPGTSAPATATSAAK